MRWACFAVAVHAVAVCICGAFAYLDGRGSYLPAGGPAELALGGGVWASLLAWFACPAVVLAQAIRRFSWRLVVACLAEAVLSYSQYVVLRPTVQ